MDDETPPPAKPSKVPSWITLGFVLGALSVLALPRRTPVPEVRPVVEAPVTPPAKAAEPAPIATIEAVFDAYDRYAVWSNDTTEVALWNAGTNSFSDCYEVLRVGTTYYYRSIPSLTRPVLAHGVVENSPLQFTETERQRAEWLREASKENLKAFSEGMRQSLGPGEPEKK
jgi:hypothetical protein